MDSPGFEEVYSWLQSDEGQRELEINSLVMQQMRQYRMDSSIRAESLSTIGLKGKTQMERDLEVLERRRIENLKYRGLPSAKSEALRSGINKITNALELDKYLKTFPHMSCNDKELHEFIGELLDKMEYLSARELQKLDCIRRKIGIGIMEKDFITQEIYAMMISKCERRFQILAGTVYVLDGALKTSLSCYPKDLILETYYGRLKHTPVVADAISQTCEKEVRDIYHKMIYDGRPGDAVSLYKLSLISRPDEEMFQDEYYGYPDPTIGEEEVTMGIESDEDLGDSDLSEKEAILDEVLKELDDKAISAQLVDQLTQDHNDKDEVEIKASSDYSGPVVANIALSPIIQDNFGAQRVEEQFLGFKKKSHSGFVEIPLDDNLSSHDVIPLEEIPPDAVLLESGVLYRNGNTGQSLRRRRFAYSRNTELIGYTKSRGINRFPPPVFYVCKPVSSHSAFSIRIVLLLIFFATFGGFIGSYFANGPSNAVYYSHINPSYSTSGNVYGTTSMVSSGAYEVSTGSITTGSDFTTGYISTGVHRPVTTIDQYTTVTTSVPFRSNHDKGGWRIC